MARAAEAIGDLAVRQIRRETKQPVVLSGGRPRRSFAARFRPARRVQEPFRRADKVPDGWTVEGDVAIDAKTAFQGGRSLLLSRSLEPSNTLFGDQSDVRRRPRASGRSTWPASPTCIRRTTRITASSRLECLDAQGKVIERIPLADMFGKRDWQADKQNGRVAEGRRAPRAFTSNSTRPTAASGWTTSRHRLPRSGAAQGRPHCPVALLDRAARQLALSQRSTANKRYRRGDQTFAGQPADSFL